MGITGSIFIVCTPIGATYCIPEHDDIDGLSDSCMSSADGTDDGGAIGCDEKALDERPAVG